MELTPGPSSDSEFSAERTPFDVIGGEVAVRTLVDDFYDRMDTDAAFLDIRRLHPDDLASSRDKLYWFLCGWLGGPQHYVQRFGHPRLRGRHMPFPIGPNERDQWIACMARTLDALEPDANLRAFLDARFAHVANFMMNRE